MPFPHHRLHTIHRLLEMLGCEMRGAHGHAPVLMAQKLLNRPRIEAFHSQDDDGPGEGSTSLFAVQARPVDGGIRLMDTGGYLVSIARLSRRAQRIITYSIDNR